MKDFGTWLNEQKDTRTPNYINETRSNPFVPGDAWVDGGGAIVATILYLDGDKVVITTNTPDLTQQYIPMISSCEYTQESLRRALISYSNGDWWVNCVEGGGKAILKAWKAQQKT